MKEKEKESNFEFESLLGSYEPWFEEPTPGRVNHSQCLHCQLSKTRQATPLLFRSGYFSFMYIYTVYILYDIVFNNLRSEFTYKGKRL